jgi:hypothetical protein
MGRETWRYESTKGISGLSSRWGFRDGCLRGIGENSTGLMKPRRTGMSRESRRSTRLAISPNTMAEMAFGHLVYRRLALRKCTWQEQCYQLVLRTEDVLSLLYGLYSC